MQRELDLVLWGATGFTGRLVAEYLLSAYVNNDTSLKWALAGRSEKKLNELKTELQKINSSANDIPIFVSDGQDLNGLRNIASKAKVICSTVGPYNIYGKTLLEACHLESTDYTDLTGEPNFIRYSLDKYHNSNIEKKIRFVHSCGFDSIPSDLGVLLLQTKSKAKFGDFSKNVIFVAGDSRGSFSGGTVASLLGVLEDAVENAEIRKIIEDPYSLNPRDIRGEDGADSYDTEYIESIQRWTAPFLMGPINTRVVRRSSALMFNSNPYLYKERMEFGEGIGGWFFSQSLRVAMSALLVMGINSITRNFIKSFIPAGEGPSEDLRETGYFNAILLGFKDEVKSQEDIRIVIHGKRDPGYGATSRMLAEASVALAKGEVEERYGVITPASAFGLRFLDRLEKVDIQFRVA
jgi:short subunit dehydrogenase-like uncharacterized protein